MSKRVLLVIKTDETLRELLSDFLTLEGYIVVLAKNNRKASSLLQKGAEFDLIIVDDVNNIEGFLFLVKLDDQTNRMPILVILGGKPIPPVFEKLYAEFDVTFIRKSVESFMTFIDRILAEAAKVPSSS